MWIFCSGNIPILFYLFGCNARGMQDLSSRAGIEPVPPAVEVGSLKCWTTREVQHTLFKKRDVVASSLTVGI